MIDEFLKGLGFSPSSMDPCLYKRSDALIILFVDDLRVAATTPVLKEIHAALFEKFQITTSDGTRFLSMDTLYDIKSEGNVVPLYQFISIIVGIAGMNCGSSNMQE